MDAKVRDKLLKVLRKAATNYAEEADTAFTIALRMMEENAVAIEDLLDSLKPNDVPHNVMAELARRYCYSRTEKTEKQRTEYCGQSLVAIASKFGVPAGRGAETTYRQENKPREYPSSSRPSGEPPYRERPEEPGYRQSERSEYARAENPEFRTAQEPRADKSEKSKPGRDDWIRRMDEARRKRQHDDPERREGPEAVRPEPEARRNRGAEHTGNGFLSDAFCQPVHTFRLFLMCCLYAFLRSFGVLLLLAIVCQEFHIHTFDRIDWLDALFIVAFPFTIKKGAELYRSGWYS